MFPIECDNIDTGLTIFSTLNDRGLPLSDSDIFKAQIYKTKITNEDKNNFTIKWKELSEIAEDSDISLDEIFRFYTHIIRARNGDKSKEIGLRKFYSQNNYNLLRSDTIVDDLIDLANFWYIINTRRTHYNDRKILNFDSQKYLHCLQTYPNDFWKYIVSVYYYFRKEQNNFVTEFSNFLKKLTAFLFAKFIQKPTSNAIKDDIFQGCVDIFRGENLNFHFYLDDDFKNLIRNSNSSKISKSLLLLYAYLNENQNTLIPAKFEIEHILPRIWQNANYNGWNEEDAREYIEKYGNKVVIEKKLNIQAGNEYFGRKKEKYRNSNIAEVKELSNYNRNDWSKDDIEERENNFINKIWEFFQSQLSQ